TLEARKASSAGQSYTKSLYEKGPSTIGAKVREEASELAAALENESNARVTQEAADVIYHMMVGLRHRGIALCDVLADVDGRAGPGRAAMRRRPRETLNTTSEWRIAPVFWPGRGLSCSNGVLARPSDRAQAKIRFAPHHRAKDVKRV